jgi:beta-fructofuranosidase
MRDPWVMHDPAGDGWIMYFTARVPGRDEPNAGGAIGFATSPDLYTWTLRRPVYDGGAFGQLEVPQVFEAGGR